MTPPSDAAGVRGYLATLRAYMDVAAAAALTASPGAEAVLTNAISPYGHDIAEALGVPSVEALLQPAEPSSAYPPMVQGMDIDAPNVLAIGDVPHNLLLPRAAAVVHQAGAGVTAAALRAGVPSVPVPVHTDQPFWGRRLAALDAGTRPLPAKGLRSDALIAAIETARTSETLRAGARAVSEALSADDGTKPLRDRMNGIAG